MAFPDRTRRDALQSLARAGACTAMALAAPGVLLAQASVDVPNVLARNLVLAAPTIWNDRSCLAVELTDEVQAHVVATRGGNGPSYAIVDRDFVDGVIEVDLAGELTNKGGADARGFVGVAFHIDADNRRYEAIYLRMTNGRLNRPQPPAPRIDRAIQYVAHPDFHFNVSRARVPGRYERGADVALGRWHHLRIEIAGPRARALLDGNEALVVDDLHYGGRSGSVGLFVDDGSRGYFHQLQVVRAAGADH